MTLRIHAPNPMRVGETANVLVTSDNPGVVSLTYGAGLTGPASVTIEGTRVYGNMGSGGDYASLISSVASGRLSTTIFLEVDVGRALAASQAATNGATTILPVFGSIRTDLARRPNWMLYLRSSNIGTYALGYFQSSTSSTGEIFYIKNSGYSFASGKIRFAVVLDDGTGGAGSVLIYTGARANVDSLSRAATSGTMGGTEALVLTCGSIAGKISRAATDGELDTWFGGGDIPATNREVYYAGGQEPTPGQIVYDSVGTNDLGPNDITGWQDAALVHPDYTDDPGDPVVPYALVPVTAIATTGTTIDATRPRQGVPARASEAERIETADQVTVTVEAPLVSIGPDTDATVEAYPADLYLQVCAQPDGVVSLASDDANLAVPATVEIVGGSATVTATALADVTGAIITATYGATTDEATVSVTEAAAPAETLVIGPDTDTEVESYPDAIILLLTSNVDGDVEIVSDDPNLIPVSPVTVIDGQAEVACLVTADVTGATVTASRDPGPSDSCSVTVSDVLTGDWIAVGPNQRTRIEGKRIVWPIRVRSSKDGAFIATASPEAGLIVSGPFELSGGACDITAQPTQAGTWTLTVEQDGRTDSVTLEALSPVAIPTVRQYNLSAEIDGFFDSINRKYGFRPRFTPANVQDVRAEHATDRTYSRYAQGTGQPGSVFGAVALSYQVMISYSSATMAEQDLGILREEADRYGWNAIGFSMTGQTMFEPVKMMPRLTLTMNFDIIPQGR
jgi:hypothetical protein